MDKLIEEIDYRCNLSDTEMTLLRQTLRILHFPKGSIVIGEGKTDDSIYFLDKGVWRAYIEEEGEQQTKGFAVCLWLYGFPCGQYNIRFFLAQS